MSARILFGFGVAASEDIVRTAPKMTCIDIEPSALLTMLNDMADAVRRTKDLGAIGFVFTPTRAVVVGCPKGAKLTPDA